MWGILLLHVALYAQNQPLEHFENAFLAQNKYPSGLTSVDWYPDDYEVQGVTNDGSNWFFTIVDQDKTHGIMWRIPKSVALNGNVSGKTGVFKAHYDNIPDLKAQQFWHWGDPDHLRYNGADYVLVPINSNPPAIVCFKASNLSYVNYAWLDVKVNGGGGWCAVGTDQDLYASINNPGAIAQYDADWETLVTTQKHEGIFEFVKTHPLKNTNGSNLKITDMQGGEFSPSGEMLYLVSGRGECLGNGAPWTPQDGIHAIRTDIWTQVDQSDKNAEAKTYFSYDYDPTCLPFSACPTGSGSDTPEGLTFWDLEDGSAPGIRGSLHVLVDRYTWGGIGCDDELIFHHYSTKIFIDKNATGGPGLPGRRDHPFNTFSDALQYYPIWSGAHLVLRPGEYPVSPVTLTKRMLITSEGGSATIR